ncbi:MAG: hypothetical protein H7Y86_05780 [Rhizobacter sp.]|nr:hypothetical protein [Ferruginibacter sp.]
MKGFIFMAIGCAGFCLAACNTNDKEKKSTGQSANTTDKRDAQISFKVNGQLVTTTGWNISRFDMGKGTQLNITTNMHEDKRTIMINVKGTAAGDYSIKTDGQAYGDYKPDYNDLLNFYSFKDGIFSINTIDTVNNILNAAFEGTVQNSGGESLNITEGKILNAKLTPGVTRY